jgi:hypothetical protein
MKLPTQFGKVLAGLLCVVLACFMTVEVAHNHPANDIDGAHCPICATAHIAIDSPPSVFTAQVLYVLAAVSVGEPLPGSRAVVFTAFIRPPPALLPSTL